MALKDYEKDRETGDTEAVFRSNIDMSPIERVVSSMEDAFAVGGTEGLACVKTAEAVSSGILCGIEDDEGQKKYYIAKPGSPDAVEYEDTERENLYELFKAVSDAYGKSKLTMKFSVEDGFHGEIGEKFEIDAPREDSQKAREALENEMNRQNLIHALDAMIPIMGKLGAEGLFDPQRKMSVAGDVARLKRDIRQDMIVYEVLKRDKDNEIKLFKEKLEKDFKNLKRDHVKLKKEHALLKGND